MFVDEVTLKLQAGRGGNGRASFYPNKGGPNGGNGGRGGDIYVRVNKQMSNLNKYAGVNQLSGHQGEQGGSNRQLGQSGKPLFLEVPSSTTIKDLESGQEVELTDQLDEVLVAKGGAGGFGNDAFKSSTNQAPKKATPGKDGQVRRVKLILKLIADFGLIGKPNIGKSTLLNELTAAQARTANYEFTTLEPNLGVLNGKIIADIPGLIEGASKGKGLGIKFLKHIEKVKLLIYCIAADSQDVTKDFETVRKELEEYNPALMKKSFIILLTKTDLVDEKEVDKKVKELKKLNEKVYSISVLDNESLENLKKVLS